MPDLGPLVEAIGTLVKPLLRAFFRTAAGMFALSLLLAIVVYKIAAASGETWKALVAVLLVLILGAVLGGMLSIKRAVLTALREGAAAHKLGQRTLDALFGRLFGLSGGPGGQGQRPAGALAQTAEKLPLGRAEQLAKEAAAGLIREGEKSGFFRARLHRMLVERIEGLTLARFRAEDNAAGGVDLVKVRDELASTVEQKLLGILDGMMLKFTALICLGFAAGAILIAEGIKRI
jgi:hypothetical protein